MSVIPNPANCTACGGGGSSTPGVDVEDLVLCDFVGGVVVGSAIAVYEYDDSTGAPTGAPTFVVPGTNTPYVVQGSLQACVTESCGPVTSELLCDNTATDVYTPYVFTQVWNCDGTLASSSSRDLTGAGYVPVGIPGACPDPKPTFAGFVCDVFGGSAAIPAVAPTCPGGALGVANLSNIGSGMTEGPTGTWTQTSNTNPTLTFGRTPDDDQHAICSVRFVNDASTGDNAFWQELGSFVDANGNPGTLDAVWIAAIEAALGVGDASDIPSGSSATANVGGTAVTITFDGPSPHSQMFASNGAFFIREQDGDGQAAGITLDFNPPVRSFMINLNNLAGDPGTLSGLQQANATPGSPAIPAQPAGVFEVKQFRNADGTAFYENLDGTAHTILGSIGECGERVQEVLCDATGASFLRVYTISGGAVSSTQDYDLDGAVFASAAPVGRCSETLATYRHTPAEVLCYTAADGVTVTQFLRRYLIDQDGINVVAVIDTLLDGITPFVAFIGGTVAQCAADGSAAACSTASSIGTICYTPPAFVPAVFLTDDWNGVTIVGTSPGPQTFTNNNFGGAGRVVVASLNKGAGLTGNDILLGIAPTTAGSLYHEHIDLGGMVTGLDITFHSFGTLGSEVLLNITPVADSITGAGTLSAGGAVANPNSSNGTVTLHWNGPLSAVDFDWKSTAGGTLSTLSTVSFTTVASGSSTATVGTAAVLLDCSTGEVTYRDLATGLVLDLSTVTIVDCSDTATAVTLSSQARLLTNATPWTPADVTGTLTSATFTVISGTANFVDSNGTAVGPLPTGATFGWAASDENTLTAPQSVTPAAGSTVLAVWSER